ncbi:MAG TPA: hypothetical protein PL033_17830 [Candidatus Brocadiia bacterium]|nr:hypothetical protein [Candidatus Brocadiia bacterium]
MVDASPLFQPLKIKGFTVRNRIVLPPMVELRGITSDAGIEWYRERSAGVGLTIVEATPTVRVVDEFSVEGLRRLTDAIHAGGALAAIQLFPIPFSWPMKDPVPTPADMDNASVELMLERYRLAAAKCAQAGFDGVEPHGAHGYLLNQFFSPKQNTRTDWYGGSLEKRMRMGMEVVRAARRGLGRDKLLLYRHTPVEDGAYGIEDSLLFAAKLVEAGVDVLDISPASAEAPGDRSEPFRKLGVPVIAVNHMDLVERTVEAMEKGRADLIAVGRGMIADPQWPQKVQAGKSDEIVKCVLCNKKCFGHLKKGLAVECTQWQGGGSV